MFLYRFAIVGIAIIQPDLVAMPIKTPVKSQMIVQQSFLRPFNSLIAIRLLLPSQLDSHIVL